MTVLTHGNPRLDGHKLLLLAPWPLEQDELDNIAKRFPGLEIVYKLVAWSVKSPSQYVNSQEWQDVTILLTGSALPAPQDAPKLRYVQLSSAGANNIVKNPLFTDTDVSFCTANGVHGCDFLSCTRCQMTSNIR
jgi:hypothetical protein